MNKDIIVKKIEYLTSLSHSALVEHCIYLENENDNYKVQKYITDFISENGIICEKDKKIEQLQQRIYKAIEYIKNHSNCSAYFEDGKMIIDNIESIYGGYELLEILGGKE